MVPVQEFAYKQYADEKPKESHKTVDISEKRKSIDLEDGSKKDSGSTEAKLHQT